MHAPPCVPLMHAFLLTCFQSLIAIAHDHSSCRQIIEAKKAGRYNSNRKSSGEIDDASWSECIIYFPDFVHDILDNVRWLNKPDNVANKPSTGAHSKSDKRKEVVKLLHNYERSQNTLGQMLAALTKGYGTTSIGEPSPT
jgi:hypothetical protein